jgi:hypothetical protein
MQRMAAVEATAQWRVEEVEEMGPQEAEEGLLHLIGTRHEIRVV